MTDEWKGPVRTVFLWMSGGSFVAALAFVVVARWSPGAMNAAVAFTVIGLLIPLALLVWAVADRSPS